MIKQARESIHLSRGGVDMVIRGKKTGLCYRWEEAACLPTKEQAEKLKDLLPLGDEFDKQLEEAYSNKTISGGAEKSDVFIYPPAANGRHPCEKPESLMRDLLLTFGTYSKTVIDPFMGSGSTGVAALQLGREFMGIENIKEYFNIAKARITDAGQQPPLFQQ
jgi:DNA modification methylase